jgi:FeS assembly SUF system regulator
MLRISKLTDYGIVLLVHLAHEAPGTTRNAREMAEATDLPLPAVSKMLKSLAAAELLESLRGARGGYRLARDPGKVTVAEILEALEGPIALMDCTVGPGHCDVEASCGVREPWQRINRAVHDTLRRVTLEELAHPTPAPLLDIERAPHPETRPRAGVSRTTEY